MYTVYQTTCTVNNKFYIGVHKTDNPDDDYLGSGKILKRAIKKYGRENFEKKVLFTFDNPEEAFEKESEIVNEVMIADEQCYNLKIGGEGGWDYHNNGSDIHRDRCSKAGQKSSLTRSKELKSKVGKSAIKTRSHSNPNIASEIGRLGGYKTLSDRSGRYSKHSIEKRKLKFKEIGHQSGEKNSSYGTMWITDGFSNLKIKKDDMIPEGWRKGRTLIK